MQIFDKTISDVLKDKLLQLEEKFVADVVLYYGVIHPAFIKPFRDFIEDLKSDGDKKRTRLAIILNTNGGSVETVEKMVEITRYHYPDEVYFIVPDYAMSAGTIWCMSGDKIYMDYTSSLGPIDPQVDSGKGYVPALGYLDKVNELLEKARNNELTNAEFAILQSQDLAMLRSFEQARELTVSLLKEWLVKYKFKTWTDHNSTNPGTPVSDQEKQQRAEDIARLLGDNKYWHSHGRFIGINTLRSLLKLKIEDCSQDGELRTLIRSYNDLICEYITRSGLNPFLHSRRYF
ncbi:MAG: serine dehydrogenasease [Saprospiraceae bacterium]|nr:MAG: serine dehydrogenasease [Saprospiraceae bacterium]